MKYFLKIELEDGDTDRIEIRAEDAQDALRRGMIYAQRENPRLGALVRVEKVAA